MTVLQFFNQHSYLLISAIVLGIVAIALFRRHARRAWVIWIGVLAIVITGWFALRTGEGAQFNSVDDYEAALRTGQPTLVEFYSDYWIACLSIRPVVDRLQADWKTGQVLRVDILTPVGREFARQHEFVGTPTFVLFDGAGTEVKRWQAPPSLSELSE